METEKDNRQKPYDPKEFKDKKTKEIDFRKADGYDEDLVRANLNRVKRDYETCVVAPTLQKEIVYIPPTNFVKENMSCGKSMSRLNSAKDKVLRVQRDVDQKYYMSEVKGT